MYKKQMTFQRIVCMAMLAACAIVFIYSLGLMTDIYNDFFQTFRNMAVEEPKSSVEGGEIYLHMQEFNRNLTTVSIVLVLVAVFNLVMGSHTRRKYYIGNYFSNALCVICNIAATVWSFMEIKKYRDEFVHADFVALKEFLEGRQMSNNYSDSTFWFDAWYGVFGLLLLLSVLLIVNVVLKIIVMNSEKRLIGCRKDVRA